MYLICCVSAQHIQRWRHKFRLDRHGLVTFLFSRSQCLLDGVDSCWRVTSQLDIGTELNRLRGESAGDG